MTETSLANMNYSEYLSRFKQYDKKYLFYFDFTDHLFVFIGYPYWRAYLITKVVNFSLEVFPVINIKAREVTIPKELIELNPQLIMADYDEQNEKLIKDFNRKVAPFFDLIPEEIYELVCNFRESQWEIIKAILINGENILQLLKTSPIIAFLLINLRNLNPSFHLANNMDYVSNLVLDKQKEILVNAKLPGTQRMVKLLSKFEPEAISIQNLILLSQITQLGSEVKETLYKFLSHEEKIKDSLFSQKIVEPLLFIVLTPKAIREFIALEDNVGVLETLRKIYFIMQAVPSPLPKLKSIQNIEESLRKYKLIYARYLAKVDFYPPPPIPGNEFIIPIQTRSELKSWAMRQQNCIRTYHSKIKKGNDYLYKVILDNEEATLHLEKRVNWFIKELSGVSNKKVSLRLKTEVKKWFLTPPTELEQSK